MVTVLNFGDLIKFHNEQGQELLGIVTGSTDDGQAFQVSTLTGQRHEVPPNQAIITMGNYFDSPDFQKTIRNLSSIQQ